MGRWGLAKEVRQEEAGKGGAFSQASLWVLPGAGIGQGEDSVLGVHTLPLNTCALLPGPEEDQCSYSLAHALFPQVMGQCTCWVGFGGCSCSRCQHGY